MPIAIVCAAAVAALLAVAGAQGATIHRCPDGRGGVLYTDEPCRGGVVLDTPRSAADPAAIERLRRDLEAFDKRQAARDAAANEAARQRELLYRDMQRQRAEDEYRAQREAQDDWYYFAYGGWWGPSFVTQPHVRPKPVRPPKPSFVPARPSFKPSPPPFARARPSVPRG